MGLDSVEFVMELEEEFTIEIQDADAEQMRKLGDMVRYLDARTDVLPHTQGEDRIPTIRVRVREMISEFTQVDIATLSDKTDIVDDLGMD